MYPFKYALQYEELSNCMDQAIQNCLNGYGTASKVQNELKTNPITKLKPNNGIIFSLGFSQCNANINKIYKYIKIDLNITIKEDFIG